MQEEILKSGLMPWSGDEWDVQRAALMRRIAELEAENARLREALERARNWVDFSARSLGAGVSSYAVAESLHHESARISADLSAPSLTDPQPAAGTEEI